MSLFLSTPALIVYALIAAWFWHTNEIANAITAHNNKANAARREAVSEYVVDMSARNTAMATELATERGRVKTETVTLQKEVTRYVTPLADAKCIVPVGFVQHYNAAWSLSAFPAAPSGLVDQPSGIPLSRVESINTDNAGAAKEWRVEALGWRRWYVSNKAKHDAFAASTVAGGNGGKSAVVSQPQKTP